MTIELAKLAIKEEIANMQKSLDAIFSISSGINEEQFPRVYNLRGIVMNLKSILAETDKGINSEFIDLGYFSEKLESLERDIKGFVNSYVTMTNGHYRRLN